MFKETIKDNEYSVSETLTSNTCSYPTQCKQYKRAVIYWGQIIHMVALGNIACVRGKQKTKYRSFLSLCLSVVMILEGQNRYIFIFNLIDKIKKLNL